MLELEPAAPSYMLWRGGSEGREKEREREDVIKDIHLAMNLHLMADNVWECWS